MLRPSTRSLSGRGVPSDLGNMPIGCEYLQPSSAQPHLTLDGVWDVL